METYSRHNMMMDFYAIRNSHLTRLQWLQEIFQQTTNFGNVSLFTFQQIVQYN